ncbi:HAD family hydrolase [Streptomyces reticuliscabiei]|uniref:HAD family hydrolase n=1 Tax=Streptomyces reticuliscabiei TaxID=146821 RepID=UPI000A3B9385|nr:HAD-IB family phosphatase [Streptomyces reticuliscabiei]
MKETGSMNRFRAAVLDIDHTLTTEASISLVNRELGVDTEEFFNLGRSALAGRISARAGQHLMREMWERSGRATHAHLTALFESVPLRPDAAAFVADLQKRGMHVCLITSSANLFAAVTAARLGITEYYANLQLSFDHEGRLTDLTANLDAAGLKKQQLLAFCDRHQVAPHEILAVGDADNDKDLFTVTGNGVLMGNNSNAHLASSAWRSATTLREVTALLASLNSFPDERHRTGGQVPTTS